MIQRNLTFSALPSLTGQKVSLTPVTKTTSAQQVAQQILDMVRQGHWQPGDKLPVERELIEQLAVGRSTVREALQILSTLNVVNAVPGHGTYVTKPELKDVLRPDLFGLLIGNAMAMELLEAREMIEPSAVRLACLRATEDDFQKIEQLLDEHEAACSANLPVSQFAASFHVLLAEASHNQVIVMFMQSLLELLQARGRPFDHLPDFKARELAEHREILRLVRAREPHAAADFLLEHIVTSAAAYDTATKENNEDV